MMEGEKNSERTKPLTVRISYILAWTPLLSFGDGHAIT